MSFQWSYDDTELLLNSKLVTRDLELFSTDGNGTWNLGCDQGSIAIRIGIIRLMNHVRSVIGHPSHARLFLSFREDSSNEQLDTNPILTFSNSLFWRSRHLLMMSDQLVVLQFSLVMT